MKFTAKRVVSVGMSAWVLVMVSASYVLNQQAQHLNTQDALRQRQEVIAAKMAEWDRQAKIEKAEAGCHAKLASMPITNKVESGLYADAFEKCLKG